MNIALHKILNSIQLYLFHYIYILYTSHKLHVLHYINIIYRYKYMTYMICITIHKYTLHIYKYIYVNIYTHVDNIQKHYIYIIHAYINKYITVQYSTVPVEQYITQSKYIYTYMLICICMHFMNTYIIYIHMPSIYMLAIFTYTIRGTYTYIHI